jgi:hypothetical protein
LLFRTVVDGVDSYFEVRRSWHLREGRFLKEILSVFKDGVYDALTEDETSSQALGAAIKSLLGLDIVERLIADAAVIQARQAKEGATAGHREDGVGLRL